MKKSNKKIITLWSILIFSIALSTTSCRQQQKSCDAENQTELTVANNKFIGVWEFVGIPYFREFGVHLTIYADHYFVYDGGACESSFGAWGNWILNGDTLILNSFEKAYENCELESWHYFTYIRFTNEKFVIIDSILTHIPRIDSPCLLILTNNFFKIAEGIE